MDQVRRSAQEPEDFDFAFFYAAHFTRNPGIQKFHSTLFWCSKRSLVIVALSEFRRGWIRVARRTSDRSTSRQNKKIHADTRGRSTSGCSFVLGDFHLPKRGGPRFMVGCLWSSSFDDQSSAGGRYCGRHDQR